MACLPSGQLHSGTYYNLGSKTVRRERDRASEEKRGREREREREREEERERERERQIDRQTDRQSDRDGKKHR